TPNLFSDLGDNWKSYNQTYDPKGDVSEEQKPRVIEFSRFASTASDSDFAAKIGDYIDLDNFARYMAITTWLTDLDGILGPGQKLTIVMGPGFQGGTAVTPINPFVKARAKSVADQLEGRSKGDTIKSWLWRTLTFAR